MSIRLDKSIDYNNSTESGIGGNSMVLDGAYFLQQTSGIIEKATAGARIVWVNVTEWTMTSDNETVAKKRINFVPASAGRLYEVEISWGTITVADEGKFYNLSDADTVDWITESATTGQLQLVKFVKATKSIFKIVNL